MGVTLGENHRPDEVACAWKQPVDVVLRGAADAGQGTGNAAGRLSGGAVEHCLGPLVQARAGQFGGQRGLAMNLGADPEHDLSRMGLQRFATDPSAGLDVVLDSLVKGLPQPTHRIGMIALAIADTGNPARENPVFVIVADSGVCSG